VVMLDRLVAAVDDHQASVGPVAKWLLGDQPLGNLIIEGGDTGGHVGGFHGLGKPQSSHSAAILATPRVMCLCVQCQPGIFFKSRFLGG
jgi:hypothetical protein